PAMVHELRAGLRDPSVGCPPPLEQLARNGIDGTNAAPPELGMHGLDDLDIEDGVAIERQQEARLADPRIRRQPREPDYRPHRRQLRAQHIDAQKWVLGESEKFLDHGPLPSRTRSPASKARPDCEPTGRRPASSTRLV